MNKSELKQKKNDLIRRHKLWIDDKPDPDAEQFTAKHLQELLKINNTLKEEGKAESLLNMRNVKLVSANFAEAKIWNVDFEGANLSTASFYKSDLRGTVFVKADMSECDLELCKAQKVNFSGANLADSNLNESKLQGALLENTDLSDADLRESDLRGANLQYTSLISANLSDANAIGADFTNAEMFSATLVKTNLKGAILSGTKLYGISKDDWNVEDVVCTHIYLDNLGEKRYPMDSDFAPGKFTEEFRELPSFTFYFKQGLTPLDLMLIDRSLNQISKNFPGCHFQVDRVKIRGVNPGIRVLVEKREFLKAAELMLETQYQFQITQLESAINHREELLTEKENRLNLLERTLEFQEKQISVGQQIYLQQQAMLEQVLNAGQKLIDSKNVLPDIHVHSQVDVHTNLSLTLDFHPAVKYLENAFSDVIKGMESQGQNQTAEKLDTYIQELICVLKNQPKEKSTIRKVYDILTEFIRTLPNAITLGKILAGLGFQCPSLLQWIGL